MFSPAYSSIIPTIVPDDLLVAANSLGQVVRPAAWMLVGPLVGGLLVGAFGPGWAFLADAATFGWSALMILSMRARSAPREEVRGRPWEDVREGLRYVRSETWIWAALVAGTVSLLCTWGPWEVLVPYVVKNDLVLDPGREGGSCTGREGSARSSRGSSSASEAASRAARSRCCTSRGRSGCSCWRGSVS